MDAQLTMTRASGFHFIELGKPRLSLGALTFACLPRETLKREITKIVS